jgi:hypothetical protein
MASLEQRYDGRYRIVFCWQGKRRNYSLGKLPERDARSCLDRLEESLRFVERGLLEIPPDTDLGRFLVSGGKFKTKPIPEAQFTLADLLSRTLQRRGPEIAWEGEAPSEPAPPRARTEPRPPRAIPNLFSAALY